MSTPFIELDDVSFAYQDAPVLKNATCKILEGEYVGIIGPNGGGKTTLLKLIMGFLKPNKGEVRIEGKFPSAVLPQIGYVPQTVRFDKLFPISVLEVVLLGRLAHLPWYGRYSRKDKEIAQEALRTVGLQDFQNRAYGTLSGGQAQRTLIARALASQPKLLLLDEPTASIDAQTQLEIYNLLKTFQNEMTIIMVTHDLNAAINYVEKVLCVQQSVMTLSPEQVCEHFALGLYHSPLIQINKSEKKL